MTELRRFLPRENFAYEVLKKLITRDTAQELQRRHLQKLTLNQADLFKQLDPNQLQTPLINKRKFHTSNL